MKTKQRTAARTAKRAKERRVVAVQIVAGQWDGQGVVLALGRDGQVYRFQETGWVALPATVLPPVAPATPT